jgi:hypothetical protein
LRVWLPPRPPSKTAGIEKVCTPNFKAAPLVWKETSGAAFLQAIGKIPHGGRRISTGPFKKLFNGLIPILHQTVEPFYEGHRMRPGGAAARNVVNAVLDATGAAASYAAIKRFSKPFY